MHDSPNERLALPAGQRILLWSMRVWVIGRHHDIAAAARIQAVMERLGADEAAAYLDGFMFALSRGATRGMAIHCACHDRVGTDERILLHVLCLVQEGRVSEAFALLRGVATDRAARAALSSAQGLGTELALAGCDLLEPDAPGPSSAWDADRSTARPCAATLH